MASIRIEMELFAFRERFVWLRYKEMFCPQCGNTQPDDLKFCKTCGANLFALRRVMAARDEQDEKFDWSKTWVAEMFMSSEESIRRQKALDLLQGKTPEVRRRNEIKAGVITASVGFGLMIFLFVLMEAIVAGGKVPPEAVLILKSLWVVGVIPIMVGAALVFNGMFVSKREERALNETKEPEAKEIANSGVEAYLSPADTNDLASPSPFSVTDQTTRHLGERSK